MAKPVLDDEDQKPLDPAIEKVRRKLVRFAVINVGLLFVALMAVVAALVYKARTNAPPAAPPLTEIPSPATSAMIEGDIQLPSGSTILSQSLSGSRVTLDVELADKTRTLYLYDMAERKMIGRFTVTAQ